ncbi:branched-chain amino acid transport system ATP-binding protein [Allocatelliglobosispora scoriae]|uniref:Branched-chain amino acid transport system ATP-binding protein n=1 Tax=Allocatelliglobosispora scoriae TaxID=643052 RepID=A0A841C2A9_9ACTN|nr:ABC transporter ATP-binding protein [Allocatelliglobosispora scoriae]MBB5874494.1 branched-chain amino acid transport system ATP-binding protein [Allocatelliglobosispora scoriae]
MSAGERHVRLEVAGLAAGYRGVPVLRDITLDVRAGERVGVVGRNGAGKTTLLAALIGIVAPTRGTVRLGGHDIAGRPPYVIAAHGLGYVPQGRRLFPRLTVDENLRLAARSKNLPTSGVYDYFPHLADRRHQLAGTLSGGEQQLAAIARALAGDPKVLLLDEPAEGLSPVAVEGLRDTLLAISRDRGVGLLLVEQNTTLLAATVERALLLEKGSVVGELTAEQLGDEQSLRVFLSV